MRLIFQAFLGLDVVLFAYPLMRVAGRVVSLARQRRRGKKIRALTLARLARLRH